jgi:energy-converting hydrogenase Eha subunit E
MTSQTPEILTTQQRSGWQRMLPHLRWTRSSTTLMGLFLLTLFLIGYIWWPLAEEVLAQVDKTHWWLYMDWLLLGDFLVMSLLLVIGADLKKDALIIFVGACGGLVIESWGTQTHIWNYYTLERPPLWIIPAWPIASLSIDRLVRFGDTLLSEQPSNIYRILYWLVFPVFLGIMLIFVRPTITKSMTLTALALCITLILTSKNHRLALITFAAGSGLGYFLELWGTTRQCWTYYTFQMPPLFAVLAHGMAAVAFWRTGLILKMVAAQFGRWVSQMRLTAVVRSWAGIRSRYHSGVAHCPDTHTES